jgi:hypothetical protein
MTKETLKRIEMLLRIVGYLKATWYQANLPSHINQTQAVRNYFRNPHPDA